MDEQAKIDFQLVLFSCLLVLGVLGNTLVIHVYSCGIRKRFLKFERMILVLAVVDLLASTINPAFYIYQIKMKYEWHFGESGCKFIPAIGPILSSISLGMILLMAIDRDRAVCTPFKKQFSLPAVYKALLTTALFSICVNIPYMTYLRIIKYQDKLYCTVPAENSKPYLQSTVAINTISDSTFLFIFLLTTARVCYKLTHTQIMSYPKSREFRARETKRILRMIIAMGLCFITLIFPKDIFMTVNYISRLHPPIIDVEDQYFINAILKVIHVSNSVINVFLYSLLNPRFRRDIVRLVMKYEFIRQLSGYSGSTETSYYSEDSNSRYQSRKQSNMNQSLRMKTLHSISVQAKVSIQIEPADHVVPSIQPERAHSSEESGEIANTSKEVPLGTDDWNEMEEKDCLVPVAKKDGNLDGGGSVQFGTVRLATSKEQLVNRGDVSPLPI